MQQLPPNPKLRDVLKICKSSKDVDFLKFFDSNQSKLYLSVRHRYNQLIDVVANGISHLKLFTKFLQQIINAQQLSSSSCLNIIEQYKEEEPTLSNSASAFVKLADETSITLPPHLQSDQKNNDKNDIYDLHKKTDIDAFSDIFQFERNMGKLLVMYYHRLNAEIYEPLYEYRKTCIAKLESIQLYVSDRYDKLIKVANKLRETKIHAISLWNDLCDVQHTLRKQRSISPDSNKTKKLASKVKNLQTKCKKQFEIVVEQVDKFNNIQSEFWEEILHSACLQLESMEYSRICFYEEYFDKYYELLKWRKAELENGCETLARAKKMLMTPFEINEYNIHPLRINNGNYQAIQAQQYELPCMPDDILTLTGNITEQRIDPSILIPVFNPFGEVLKPSTSRHIKSNYSRADSVIIHDRMSSTMSNVSISRSPTNSISSISSINIVSLPQSNTHVTTFFSPHDNANTASKLFSRTNRISIHNGGLPRPPPQQPPPPQQQQSYDEYSKSREDSMSSDHQPPPKRKLPITGNIDANKPPLPMRKNSKSPRNSPHLPPRPPPGYKKSKTPIPMSNGPPQLPPRRQTLPHGTINNFKRKPPKKNPTAVAEKIRKESSIVSYNSDSNSNSSLKRKKGSTKKRKVGK